MLRTGLIKPTDGGKEPYDLFRDRIMFPINDPSGRVIAFSGRILTKDTEAPKYVNSPETALFNKSEALFGYDKAKQGIRQYDFSLIVEGQFDVVLAHQAGYHNAVAVSGTALTPHHVALLQRLSNRVVLALDADRAGIAAVRRAADLMLARGMDVKVARLPQGEDPADMIRKDPKQFKDSIGHATHVIEFLLAVLKEEARDVRAYKLRVRDEILPYLLRIENHIDRDHFATVIAHALETMKESIMLEVDRLAREHAKKQTASVAVYEQSLHEVEDRQDTYSRKTALIHYCIALGELLDEHEKRVLYEQLALITATEVAALKERIPPAVFSPLLFTLETEVENVKRRELYQDTVTRLRELRELILKEEIRTKRKELSVAESTGDEAQMATLLDAIGTLQRKLSESPLHEGIFIEESGAV